MRALACAAIVVVAAACGGSDGPTTATSNNKAFDVFANAVFSPNFLQISQGDTVRFNIVPGPDGDGHDVTFRATPGAPANIKVTLNGIIPRVFTAKGNFHYDCFVHPGMSGDIVVQ